MREVDHAFWERLVAASRHELGVVARMSPVGTRLAIQLAISCRCGWEVDEQSASPREDARAHVAEGRHVS